MDVKIHGGYGGEKINESLWIVFIESNHFTAKNRISHGACRLYSFPTEHACSDFIQIESLAYNIGGGTGVSGGLDPATFFLGGQAPPRFTFEFA